MNFFIWSDKEAFVAESQLDSILGIFKKRIDLVFQLLMVNVEGTENFSSTFGWSLEGIALAVPRAIIKF